MATRTEPRISQAALAERAGISRKWVYEFESGKPTAELGLLLRVLDILDGQLAQWRASGRPSLGHWSIAVTFGEKPPAAGGRVLRRTGCWITVDFGGGRSDGTAADA